MKNFITKANLSGGDDSGTATKWGAKESNSVTDELKLAVTATGQSLTAGTGNDPSPDLLAKALTITSQTAHSYQDSGAVDAYVLTRTGSLEQPDSYEEGMQITFVTANQNTGASTVNVSGLGVKAIVRAGDVALSAGDISANVYMELIYDPAADSASGGFVLLSAPVIKVTVLTISDPTWTPAAATTAIEFTVVGAGAGGGGVDGQGAGTAAAAGSGAGGATAIKLTTVVESSYNITVGAAGSGGGAGVNDGTNGGTSSIASVSVNITSPGGSKGIGALASSGTVFIGGGNGNAPTGGDINSSGGDGTISRTISGDIASFSTPGVSSFGGLQAPNSVGAPSSPVTPGAGGAGANAQDVVTNFAGADGADGIIIIKEYF